MLSVLYPYPLGPYNLGALCANLELPAPAVTIWKYACSRQEVPEVMPSGNSLHQWLVAQVYRNPHFLVLWAHGLKLQLPTVDTLLIHLLLFFFPPALS